MKIFLIILTFLFSTYIVKSGDEFLYGFDEHWSWSFPNGKDLWFPFWSGISFCDSSNGMIISQWGIDTIRDASIIGQGTIWRTTDGGKTWKIVYEDKNKVIFDSTTQKDTVIRPCNLNDIAYVDSSLCVTVFSDFSTENKLAARPYFMTSRNNGDTWEKTELPETEPYNPYFRRVVFNEKKQGLIFSNSGYILKSLDTGKTWQKIPWPNTQLYELVDMNIIDDSTFTFLNRGLFVVNGSTVDPVEYEITITKDNCKTWITNKLPKKMYGSSLLCFHNINEGWFGGYLRIDTTKYLSTVIYHTTDGGKNWECQLDTINYLIEGNKFGNANLKFFDNNYGIFSGGYSNIYLTSDGGKNWIQQTKYNKDTISGYYRYVDLNYFCFLNKDKIMGLGSFTSRIYLYDRNTPVSVEETHQLPQNLFCAPNPTNKILTISYQSNYINQSKIELYNLLGIKQKEINYEFITGENTITFDVSGLTTGVYFVIISDGTEIRKQMFVKE